MINNTNINSISGIGDSDFFIKNYQNFLSQNEKCNLLVIDLTNFKNINDSYGHIAGDECLILFSKILMEEFNTSLVSRLHGDEFAVLTNKSKEEITKRLENCIKKIKTYVYKQIPRFFEFSCGIVDASKDYEDSFVKADYMMYHAKRNKKLFQFFSNDIWKEKIELDSFSNSLLQSARNNSLIYYGNPLFDICGRYVNIDQIYTRGSSMNHIFDAQAYQWLRDNYKIIDFDISNVMNLLNNLPNDGSTKIILIDYLTLCNSKDFNRLVLNSFKDKNVDNILMAIDLGDLNAINYESLIKNINELKVNGFNVILDKIDNYLSDVVWEQTEPKYIIISPLLWKKTKVDDKSKYILQKKLELYSYNKQQTIPIFSSVGNEEEAEYVKSLIVSDSLFNGRYYSKEKRLILK